MIDNLILDAIAFTEIKIREGLLVWDEIPELTDSEWNDWWSTANGDRETLYSIASIYSQFPPEGMTVNECREILENVLCEKYPKYCD